MIFKHMWFEIHFIETFKIGGLVGHVKHSLNLIREKRPEIDVRFMCCVSY